MSKEELEELKEMLTTINNRNQWAMDCDYEGGSMWEACEIGMSQADVKLSQKILDFIEDKENV